MANLIGKNVLIVDEVDDTRTTLEYAVRELQKDVQVAQEQLGREGEKTTFSVFVLHSTPGPVLSVRKMLFVPSKNAILTNASRQPEQKQRQEG
ncbi:hypothetical protein EMCG_08948 [[Emmonsia] crescens]|uniref:Uncharacterized protein n=1 Tax=[Emmonsia] crescens TaxID=73230 RepID=A0A0G2I4M1_9EURO|nr:hypothetical protein EMCG_08948 [Emmonsia crescens UAMH 3008]